LALFDYVLRGEQRSTRAALEGALRPIIVLGAVIAFVFSLALHRPKPVPKVPTEVKFLAPSSAPSPSTSVAPGVGTPVAPNP